MNSGFKFNITHSDTYKVTITSNDNLVDYIQIYKTGNTLQILLKPGISFQSTSLKVEVTMPNLYGLDINGGAKGNVSGFSSSHDFHITSAGGGVMSMVGVADDLVMEASGGSRLDLSNFHVNEANVVLSGGSLATIYLDGKLDATLSGGTHLTYTGNPTMGTINTSGGGTISKK